MVSSRTGWIDMDFKNVAQKKITFEGVELYNPVISELSEIYENEEDFYNDLMAFQDNECLKYERYNKQIIEFKNSRYYKT